jgi:hypothetical protein
MRKAEIMTELNNITASLSGGYATIMESTGGVGRGVAVLADCLAGPAKRAVIGAVRSIDGGWTAH